MHVWWSPSAMLASDATPGNHDEAAIAAALATDPAWHWTVPPPAVASRLQRSDFDDEEAWNSHRCKRRAQQKALHEKSRAPRDRSQRARPARARQQEERRQRRESQQIERQEALCEAARVLTARRVAAAGQSQPPPPLIGLGESEPVVRASIHLRHKLRLADVDASKEELAQMSAQVAKDELEWYKKQFSDIISDLFTSFQVPADRRLAACNVSTDSRCNRCPRRARS